MSRLITALLASTLLVSGAMAADPAGEKIAYQRQLDSVKTLTAALQRDNDAGSAEVRDALKTVGARQKEAEELAAVGEYEVAKSILDEGYKKLTATLARVKANEGYKNQPGAMAGMTGADGKLLSAEKMKADFEREYASAAAMLDAAKRTDAAKGGKHGKDIAALEALLLKARNSAAAGDLKSADKAVDEVLLKEKQLIAGLASGTGYSGRVDTATGMGGMTGNDGQPLSTTKLKTDFDRKLMSASALLDAEKRLDGEKGNSHRVDIAAIESGIARAKAMAASGDLAAANQLIDEMLVKEKQLIAATKSNDAATAGLKTGSAALESAPSRDMTGMTGEEKTAEIAKTLRSTTSLRDLLARRSQERGLDNASTLGKIDQLVREARQLEKSDPNRALQIAGNAYETAKSGVESLRAK